VVELRVARRVLALFRVGDREAFAQVVRAYGDSVRHIAARYWPGAFDQEEAVQEVWLKAYQQREALDPDRRRPRSADELEADRELPDGEGCDPERAAQVGELVAAVEDFRGRLDEGWRIFFQLQFAEGLSLAEIGDRLELRPSRCKYMRRELMRRARRNPRLLAALGRFQRWRV